MRALIDLGIAREQGQELVRLSELAAMERIPEPFLEQILLQLRQAGFLEARRGRNGGYRLARNPSDVRMGDVVRLFEGQLAPLGCVSKVAYERCSCPDEDHCGLRLLMLDVRASIVSVLDRTSLADVVGVTVRKLRRDGRTLPFCGADAERRPEPARPAPRRRKPS